MVNSTVRSLVRSTATESHDGDDAGAPEKSFARSVFRGVVGGLFATVGMSIYRLPVFGALPPTAEFWAKYVAGGDPEDHSLPAAALHLFYGAGAGGLFGVCFPRLVARVDARPEPVGVAAGVVYGLLLSAFGERVLLRGLLEMDLDPSRELVFHVGHVIYGLTLGTWVGTREDLSRREL